MYDHIIFQNRYVFVNLKENFYQLTPNLMLALGFGRDFFKKYLGSIKLLYEMQYWFSQNQTRRFLDDQNIGATNINNGDLQIHGLCATLNLKF